MDLQNPDQMSNYGQVTDFSGLMGGATSIVAGALSEDQIQRASNIGRGVGAGIGSIFGPIGTSVGGVLGGLVGSVIGNKSMEKQRRISNSSNAARQGAYRNMYEDLS